MKRASRRTTWIGLAGVILLFGASAIAWDRTHPSDLEQLQEMDEVQLGYPGSTLISAAGQDSTDGSLLEGQTGASTLAQFGSDRPVDEILG